MIKTIFNLSIVLASLSLFSACSPTSHPGVVAKLGVSSSQEKMIALLDQAGPVELQTIVAADWQVSLSGLLNLKHEKAQQAGLSDKPEAIQIYSHLLRHPEHGTFLIDSGVAAAVLDKNNPAHPGYILHQAMRLDDMKLRTTTATILKRDPGMLNGVFLTHLHWDHISGLPDVPVSVPIYIGPGEIEERVFKHAFTRASTDHLLENRPALQVWNFSASSQAGELQVVDIFADGSVFAIRSPGHTAGSVAYLVRTTTGPVLLLGDTCHTRWGWQNQVEPGDFTTDHRSNAVSLHKLYQLVQAHPAIQVRLGHQE